MNGPATRKSADSPRIADLERSVAMLRQMVRRIQAEREAAARVRRRRLMGMGVGISVVAHLVLLLYFASVQRSGGAEDWGHPDGYEIAILPLEHLSELDELTFDDLTMDEVGVLDSLSMLEPMALTEAATPAGELEAAGGGMTALGGSGGGDGDTGLGGAGTTYFGVAARGTRFAFIVDRSGSMSYADRMTIAMDELVSAIEALPDYAYFHVLLFSSDVIEPPVQRLTPGGWVQARRSNVLQAVRWLREVSPGGGTMPRSSFAQVMGMNPRPDVIFFMTDGIIAPVHMTADEVSAMNRRGKRVVVNTIAFGDQGSEDMLRRIASESGGSYRYIPDGGGR